MRAAHSIKGAARIVGIDAAVSVAHHMEDALVRIQKGQERTTRARIDQFAARLATTPRALKPEERRALVRELKGDGLLDLRRSMETIAAHLGVSRATVYSYAK